MDMTVDAALARFVGGVRTLNIPRVEDLPYWTSPPIQFVYSSSALLALGNYIWTDAPSVLTPDRPILENAVYYFRNITLTADVEELDYTTNIIAIPQFQMYRRGTAQTMMFREPVLAPKFLSQFDFRYLWATPQANDQLFATFRGQLTQGAGLIGKAQITLYAIISATEIVDSNFTKLVKSVYPAGVSV